MAKHPDLVQSTSLFAFTGSSYVLGPIDPSVLVALTLPFENGSQGSLLVPSCGVLPPALLASPAFHDGAFMGYCDEDFSEVSIPVLMNWIKRNFVSDLLRDLVSVRPSKDCYAWCVGYVLGRLSSLAVTDPLSAYTGIAHLCYLVSLVPWSVPPLVLSRVLHCALSHSDWSVGDYRARWQALKAEGHDTICAQRYALQGSPAALDALAAAFCQLDQEEEVA